MQSSVAVDFEVPPRSTADIAEAAEPFWRLVCSDPHETVPVMVICEFILSNKFNLFALSVKSIKEMGGTEGKSCLSGKELVLREDVYCGGWDGNPRDRFTVAHELGHWALHREGTLKRAVRRDQIKPYKTAEWQANQFAGELLMPRDGLHRKDTPSCVSKRFLVSESAAEYRLRQGSQQGWIKE